MVVVGGSVVGGSVVGGSVVGMVVGVVVVGVAVVTLMSIRIGQGRHSKTDMPFLFHRIQPLALGLCPRSWDCFQQ